MDSKPESSRYESVVDNFDESTHYGRILNLIGKNKKVLELGCSTGYLSEAMSGLFECDVTGVEVDPVAAEKAEGKCSRVIVADLDNCKLSEILAGESFDVVLCADVLEHLKDPVALLRELYSLLKPDGYLVASIPNVSHGSVRLALLFGQFPYRSMGLLDETHIKFYNRVTIEELFEFAGFKVESVGRNRWCVFHSETGAALPEEAREFVDLLSRDPESDTYQFLIKASPRNREEQLGKLQRSFSDAIDDSSPYPSVAIVVAETNTASLDDRFRGFLKLINYPGERLVYNFVSVQPSVVKYAEVLDNSARPYSDHDWTSWRFTSHGQGDEDFMSGARPVDGESAEKKVTVRQHPILDDITLGESEFLFFMDTNSIPSPDCLIRLLDEARNSEDDVGLFVPMAELEISLASDGVSQWTPPFLVRRELISNLIASGSGCSTDRRKLYELLLQNTKSLECKSAFYFRCGFKEKDPVEGKWRLVTRFLGGKTRP